MTRTPLRGTPLRTLLISLLAVFGLVLTACSSDDGGGDGSGDGSGDTITIEHAFGTTEIDGTPERVATVQFENQEVPLALGVVPVGMAKANFGGSDVLPWVQEQLDELGVSGDDEPVLFDESDGIDFEAVSDTAPDVILAGYSGLEQEDYDKLSEIAPTIPFPKDQVAWGTPWRENIEIESKAIGKEDEGKDLVTDLESQISEVSFYTSHDTRPMFFEDLG
ncbi:ABC transporter substrate-binding protein, partial [Corynebacterium glyciniphilum]|uniref:ABC transporter substrate-binding protein n=1 Tax=Corynebacterium glyciniphilum TaxID=1404244 RepID=UPI00264E0202